MNHLFGLPIVALERYSSIGILVIKVNSSFVSLGSDQRNLVFGLGAQTHIFGGGSLRIDNGALVFGGDFGEVITPLTGAKNLELATTIDALIVQIDY
ncbi:hypothetical protein FRB91_003751 [Serendipita sp. 411]|nr:hypothetical protein FRB91_003751 [Serendipita sp. 411]